MYMSNICKTVTLRTRKIINKFMSVEKTGQPYVEVIFQIGNHWAIENACMTRNIYCLLVFCHRRPQIPLPLITQQTPGASSRHSVLPICPDTAPYLMYFILCKSNKNCWIIKEKNANFLAKCGVFFLDLAQKSVKQNE